MDTKPLFIDYLIKIFSQSGLSLGSGNYFFNVKKLFHWLPSHFALIFWSITVLFRKLLPMTISSSVYPVSSYTNFKVLGLTLSFRS
jgi:hypothetical protein